MTDTASRQCYLCDSCSVVALNGDDSHMEPDALIRLDALFAVTGLIIYVGIYDGPGYWTCDGCWETEIGAGNIYEPLA